MLDFIELTNDNHFFDGQWLYIRIDLAIYKFRLVNYKNIIRTNKVYVYKHNNEYSSEYLAFYDDKVRKLFINLLSLNSIGLKSAELLIREFSIEQFEDIVREFKYNELTCIKGIGLVTAKNIIDSMNKKIFNITITPKQEKIIKSITRLGYSRDIVIKTMTQIDKKLNDEDMVRELLINLGNLQNELQTN